MLVVLVVLVGCAGIGEREAVRLSITEGEARAEAQVLESMAVVRPYDRDFDAQSLIGPSDCGRDGLVFSSITRGWDDVALADALEGLDAVGRMWEQRGFEMDYSRRDRPDGQEILAGTAEGDGLIAIVSAPDEQGIARFSVQADTACLEPAAE